MKKYLIHFIYLLIIGFFMVYGRIKHKEAQKQEILAIHTQQKAERQAAIAVERAAEAAREAHRVREIMKELDACKSAKK